MGIMKMSVSDRFGLFILFFVAAVAASCSGQDVFCVAPENSDIISVLKDEGFSVNSFGSVDELLESAPAGSPVLLLARTYPDAPVLLDSAALTAIREKNLRVFAEFASCSDTLPQVRVVDKERVVVADSLSPSLPSMALMSVNKAAYLVEDVPSPLLVLAKVAGLDRAEYGLDGTDTAALLYKVSDNLMLSATCLGDFGRLRYMPERRMKALWEFIMSDLTGTDVLFRSWPSAVRPSYGESCRLPRNAARKAVERGAAWYLNSGFLVDSTWRQEYVLDRKGNVQGRGLPEGLPAGDGSLGIMEGHCSAINNDGVQECRYWMRADVQGESAMALAVAGDMLGIGSYMDIASNLIDYAFEAFRSGPRSDPSNPGFGLLGWGMNHEGRYYGDDNARCLLGMCMAASLLGTDRWNDMIVESILANFRTTGRWGFRTTDLLQKDLEANGIDHYRNAEFRNAWPHFESWLWACYLWLYRQSGYEPLLDMARSGIYKTMEVYPAWWRWTNGIQQERARMILPLAWLYRVEPTEKNRSMLMEMAGELLANQVECGAIREELGGAGKGQWGKVRSNEAYGKGEAPIIFDNGDPLADLLYTTNFAFFGLNEAAKATSDPSLEAAVDRMADFIVRAQVRSEDIRSLDGAWFRAFNYRNWDYWAQDSDEGWGALCTLTGWIQGWIVTSLALLEEGSSYWDMTAGSGIGRDITAQLERMRVR